MELNMLLIVVVQVQCDVVQGKESKGTVKIREK
jgi:hypothetical protein